MEIIVYIQSWNAPLHNENQFIHVTHISRKDVQSSVNDMNMKNGKFT